MSTPTRRDFIRKTAGFGAAAAVASAIPAVHAAGNSTIQLALIGCGGRGTGAAGNALGVKNGPIKLVAMADVFDTKLNRSCESLKKKGQQFDVPEDRKFLGFDGYKKAMDCLKPGDVAILTTPPAFRWVMFQYAIQKGLNVFMEKPVTVDGPSTRKMLALAEEATKKNLKVGVGLMIRHCRGRQELLKRIQDGEIGDIVTLRAYRMGAGGGAAPERKPDLTEVMYQIRHFHAFLWASGGVYSDYYIHQIDECSWMKGAWPISAHALAGRHYKGASYDQNLDTYSIEYTYPDGTKLFYEGRQMPGCHNEFASYAHCTKGSAVISTASHFPGKVRTYKAHNQTKENLLWAYPQPEKSPYDLEWEDLIDAIRTDKPYNEAKRGAEASMVASMGRMAAHTGQIITFEQMLACQHEFAPTVDKLAADGPAPLQLKADGRYPCPQPGLLRDREY